MNVERVVGRALNTHVAHRRRRAEPVWNRPEQEVCASETWRVGKALMRLPLVLRRLFGDRGGQRG